MKKLQLGSILTILSILCIAANSYAGGALKTNVNGLPFHWGDTVVYNLENGALKNGVYDAAASRALIEEAFHQWSSVPGVDLNIIAGPNLPDGGDTTVANYDQFYNSGAWNCYDNDPATPCYSPIIFDDGSILDKLFGECASTKLLGFAGFMDVAGESDDPTWTKLKKGQAIFSGACIPPVVQKPGCGPCAQVLDDEAVRTLILHELGHLLGMGHAQVNPDSYLACNGGSCPNEVKEDLPTMFPILVKGAKMDTLHRDEKAYLQRMYGNPEQSSCTVTGNVFASDGTTSLRGVEVVAHNTGVGEWNTDALSHISGAEAPRLTSKGKTQENCIENCGEYTITGLAPGSTYQICVQRVLSRFTGVKAINPLETPFQGVDNECPESLTVTCQCPRGGPCTVYEDINIVTSNTGLDAATSFGPGDSDFSGGCSLVKRRPKPTYLWKKLRAIFPLHSMWSNPN